LDSVLAEALLEKKGCCYQFIKLKYIIPLLQLVPPDLKKTIFTQSLYAGFTLNSQLSPKLRLDFKGNQNFKRSLK